MTSKATLVSVAKASKAGRVWEHPSADEVRIYVGPHFATLTPDLVTLDGEALDAVAVEVAKAIPGRARVRTQIAEAVRAAGLYASL